MKDKKSLVFIFVISLIAFYFGNRISLIFSNLQGNVFENINESISLVFPSIVANPFYIGFSLRDLVLSLVLFFSVWLIYIYKCAGNKNYMHGAEHGTSKWGTFKDIKPLMNPIDDLNIILSETEKISVDKVKNFESDRNKNILVVGGSGSGKSYSEIKPSLMQLHSSYIITDPKGTLLPETGYLFEKNNYEIVVFNTIDFTKSLSYNPFEYINSEKDILKVVTVLMENTKGEGQNSGDKFWQDAEKLLYTAIIAYILMEEEPKNRHIHTMISILEGFKVMENDEGYLSYSDYKFEILREKNPDCLAVRQYTKFKQAAGKTMKSILISCAARLAPFDIEEVRNITIKDELHMKDIGTKKVAFFIIMSDTDSTFSFLIAMIMYQLFNTLCEEADMVHKGSLPIRVRCLLDEFANSVTRSTLKVVGITNKSVA